MTATGKTNTELVDLRDRPDEALLQAMYDDLYLPHFRIPEQMEDVSVWKRLLWEPVPPPPKPILRIVVAGEHLDDRDARTLHGFIVLEFFRRSGSGILTYVAVDPKVRRKGLGRRLVDRAKELLERDAKSHGTQLNAIFAEANDPSKMTDPFQAGHNRQTLRILGRLGARHVPIAYVQPALGPGQGRSYSLLLVALPSGSRPLTSLPSAVIRDFLIDFYGSLGVGEPEADLDFITMMRGLTEDHVRLRELDAEQSA